jgi:hypothetical protein
LEHAERDHGVTHSRKAKHMHALRRKAAVIAGALGIGGALFLSTAAGNPVAVTANVNQTISMTGPPATLSLAGDPGTNATGNIAYSVTTNDTAGYNVTVSPGSTNLANGTNLIANSAMGYVPNGGTQLNFSGATPLTVVSKSAPSAGGGDSFNDTFKLAIPGNAAAGAYNETFTYLATGK